MLDRLREIHQRLLKGAESDEDERFVTSAFQQVTGNPYSGCKCKIFDACIILIKKLTDMNEYIVKRGIVIRYKAFVLTQTNCNDAIAREYLERNPQDRHFFEKLPPLRKPSEVKVAPTPVIQEALELAEKVIAPQPIEEKKAVQKPVRKTRK